MKNKNLCIRLSEEEHKKLKALAKEMHLSVSALIIYAVYQLENK